MKKPSKRRLLAMAAVAIVLGWLAVGITTFILRRQDQVRFGREAGFPESSQLSTHPAISYPIHAARTRFSPRNERARYLQRPITDTEILARELHAIGYTAPPAEDLHDLETFLKAEGLPVPSAVPAAVNTDTAPAHAGIPPLKRSPDGTHDYYLLTTPAPSAAQPHAATALIVEVQVRR